MGAELFASPVVLAIMLAFVAMASVPHYLDRTRKPFISPWRLVAGYLAVVACCAVLAGFESYVSEAEAASKWHVAPADYPAALLRSFVFTFAFASCAALLGVALVGLPIVFALARRDRATIPAMLALSLPISALAAIALSSGDVTAFQHLWLTLGYLAGSHLLAALCFCVAAGVPWRRPAPPKTP